MFLDKYLNQVYLDIIYNNYDSDYLNSLDQDNFRRVYSILEDRNFYFIEDIILNYMELFEIDADYVDKAIQGMEMALGDDYVSQIGEDMRLIDKIIDAAIEIMDEDNR